jgi:hypothetical protein
MNNSKINDELNNIAKGCSYNGWDGDGALPLDKDCLEAVRNVVSKLFPGESNIDINIDICPCPDGGLDVYYESSRLEEGFTLSLHFKPGSLFPGNVSGQLLYTSKTKSRLGKTNNNDTLNNREIST